MLSDVTCYVTMELFGTWFGGIVTRPEPPRSECTKPALWLVARLESCSPRTASVRTKRPVSPQSTKSQLTYGCGTISSTLRHFGVSHLAVEALIGSLPFTSEEQEHLQGFSLHFPPAHQAHEDRNGTSESQHITALLHLEPRGCATEVLSIVRGLSWFKLVDNPVEFIRTS